MSRNKIIIIVVSALLVLAGMIAGGVFLFKFLTSDFGLYDDDTETFVIKPSTTVPTDFYGSPINTGINLPRSKYFTGVNVPVFACDNTNACSMEVTLSNLTRDEALSYLASIAATGYDVSWTNTLADNPEYIDHMDVSIQKDKKEVATASYTPVSEAYKNLPSRLAFSIPLEATVPWTDDTFGGLSNPLEYLPESSNGLTYISYDVEQSAMLSGDPSPGWSFLIKGFNADMLAKLQEYTKSPGFSQYNMRSGSTAAAGYVWAGDKPDGTKIYIECVAAALDSPCAFTYFPANPL